MNNKPKTIDDNTIDLVVAENMCANWREAFHKAFPNVPFTDIMRGFRIPIVDITELAQDHGAVAVRGYIAMEDPLDSATLKMLLVPIVVNSAGQEVDKITDDQPIIPPNYYIYDFTQPCPIQCDYNSPLFGSFAKPTATMDVDVITVDIVKE